MVDSIHEDYEHIIRKLEKEAALTAEENNILDARLKQRMECMGEDIREEMKNILRIGLLQEFIDGKQSYFADRRRQHVGGKKRRAHPHQTDIDTTYLHHL